MFGKANAKIAGGFLLGAVCTAVVIATRQTAGVAFDMDTLGKLATILVAPLTLGLVYLTGVLAKETRQMWVQNRQPHVLVTIEPMVGHAYWMELVVQNVGSGAAFDLVAVLDPDIERKHQFPIKVSASSLLRLPVLKPGQRFATFIGEWMHMEPRRTTFRCTCKDVSGGRHEFSNEVDLSAFETLLSTSEPPLETVAKELENIRKLLERGSRT